MGPIPVKITSADLDGTISPSALGSQSRHFFESIELPRLQKARRHAQKLSGLTVTDCVADDATEWTMTFTYRGHQFSVETNYHAALSQFYVADRACPDEVLIDLLTHFERLSILFIREDRQP